MSTDHDSDYLELIRMKQVGNERVNGEQENAHETTGDTFGTFKNGIVDILKEQKFLCLVVYAFCLHVADVWNIREKFIQVSIHCSYKTAPS